MDWRCRSKGSLVNGHTHLFCSFVMPANAGIQTLRG